MFLPSTAGGAEPQRPLWARPHCQNAFHMIQFLNHSSAIVAPGFGFKL